ncbi:MAG TPA: GFA family protein, partial [Devosia sp.]|nr:GFA family protein [Devosia sp.]
MSRSPQHFLSISASCACGQTSVRIEGPVLSMFMCACHDCQRATGTGHSTVAMVPSSALNIIGEPASFARPAESGATLSHHFCPGCGTPLYSQSSRAPDIRLIPVG